MQISIHTSAREVTSFGSVFGQYCGNFNPHFRKGSDRISTDCSPLYSIFQSTLPQGKWRKKLHHYEIGLVFQSTLPQGKWPDDFGFKCKGGEFQSTLPQGKWRCIRLERFILGYFNPHFRKGSDWYHTDITGYRRYFNPHFRKGSDSFNVLCSRSVLNFNPHFRKGSDGAVFITCPILAYFNPHFRKGSDRWQAVAYRWFEISIHTSAREVTKSWSVDKECQWNFNPHFRKGSDGLHDRTSEARMDFNPHFRKGSDCMCCNGIRWYKWFQSTLPQGKWPKFKKSYLIIWRFQSTLPQGKWLAAQANRIRVAIISIHTSAREVTIFRDRREDSRLHFNPHFRKGSDLHRQHHLSR